MNTTGKNQHSFVCSQVNLQRGGAELQEDCQPAQNCKKTHPSVRLKSLSPSQTWTNQIIGLNKSDNDNKETRVR